MGITLIYGTNWSVETWDIRRFLEAFDIAYEYIDVEKDQKALNWLRQQCNGETPLPSLHLPNGDLLLAPTRETMADYFGINLIAGSFRSDTKPLTPQDDGASAAV